MTSLANKPGLARESTYRMRSENDSSQLSRLVDIFRAPDVAIKPHHRAGSDIWPGFRRSFPT